MKKRIIIPFILGIFLLITGTTQAQSCTNNPTSKFCSVSAGAGGNWGDSYFSITTGVPVTINTHFIPYTSMGSGHVEVDLDNLMWTDQNPMGQESYGYRYFPASDNNNGYMYVYYSAYNNYSSVSISW